MSAYPFKDTLQQFVDLLSLCNQECNTIRSTRRGADSSKSLHRLKRQLKCSAAALPDRYIAHHPRIGPRWELGDEPAIHDISKATIKLRNHVFAPLRYLSERRKETYKPMEAGFAELHDIAIEICDDVWRTMEYLAERLSRKSSSPSPSPRESYSPPREYRDPYEVRLPRYSPPVTAWDPMAAAAAGYYDPVPRQQVYYDGVGGPGPYVVMMDPYRPAYVRRHRR